MSELRFNELRGEEVVYAIHRQERTFLPSREHCRQYALNHFSWDRPVAAFEAAWRDLCVPALCA